MVAALTREKRTASIQQWLADQPADELIISDWVVAEFSSALSIKVRTRQLTAHWQAQALTQFNALVAETLTVWPVRHHDFLTAARMAEQYATDLRAGDALHLAVVANRGGQLVSLDRRQVEAGTVLGVVAKLI